jgi:hypothetical protein
LPTSHKCTLAAPEKGNRPAAAAPNRATSAPTTPAPTRCVYCYAVNRRDRAATTFRRHDPAAEMLD